MPQEFATELDEIKFLRAELVRCSQERTHSAEYAVKLEDARNALTSERRELIKCLNHLLEHLEQRPLTVPCAQTHPRIKEYKL